MDVAPFLTLAESATQNVSIFDPVSPPAVAIKQLAIFVLAVCAAIIEINSSTCKKDVTFSAVLSEKLDIKNINKIEK